MAFRPPTFNLNANLWRLNSYANPPTMAFKVNLSQGKRVLQFGANMQNRANSLVQTGTLSQIAEILCPAGTDVRYMNGANPIGDLLEVPAGSGRFYLAISIDDVGKGFGNEYRLVLALQWNLWTYNYAHASFNYGPPSQCWQGFVPIP